MFALFGTGPTTLPVADQDVAYDAREPATTGRHGAPPPTPSPHLPEPRPVIVGFFTAAVAAYIAVRFLSRWFATRTPTPFAVYCLVAGAAGAVHFA
ncbi:MAG: undecaprenyl-diphosphate phosphatase [Streptomyces sp.]|nr:undecaprenyl-diphosphate phosphatase [Streptomyces sp.]